MTLTRLVRLALEVDLHSHVLLIPFIAGYLIWLRRRELNDAHRPEDSAKREVPSGRAQGGARGEPNQRGRCSPGGSAAPISTLHASSVGWVVLVLGVALAGLGLLVGGRLAPVDTLALQTASFLCLVVAGFAWFQGAGFVKEHAFALAFLVFMIPMPTLVENGLEVFFQNASAEASYWMYQLTGTTVLRTGRTFELPGLTIEVAQECSGIRSSYVLFIVSLLAGNLLLNNRKHRWLLALFVIPLGVVRNGIRILTISLLTIHWDPKVIDSPLHHRGGPIFFALSLIPLFALVCWMKRRESQAKLRLMASTSHPKNA